MSTIQPTSGIGPSAWGHMTPAGSKGGSNVHDFGEIVKNAFEHVEGQQEKSNLAIQDLVSGRSSDVLPVVEAVANADLSFKLLMGVRNKVIEAYKQTLNMSV